MIPWSLVKKLGRVRAVRLAKVIPYSVIVVDRDTFYSGPSLSDGAKESMSAVNTVRYHFHFEKKIYSLPDAVQFLRDFKPRFVKPLSANTEKGAQIVLEKAYGNILPAERDRTCDRSAPRQSSIEDGAAPAALAGPSRQRASKPTTDRSTHKPRTK